MLELHLRAFVLLGIVPATAEYHAEIRSELKSAGRPIPSNDIWVAALARQHGYGVVSRDGHFEAVRGLHLITW